MRNLLTRIISGIIFISLFIFSILFSENSYVILLVIFGFIAIWEFGRMIQFKNIIPYLLFPAVLYYFLYFAIEKRLFFLLIITLLCSIRLIYHLYSEDIKYPKIFLDKLDLSIRYIIFPFAFLIALPIFNEIYQPYIIIYVLILIWVNDSFAFLVGKNFGKHKLFERVSPKKTIEGFIGGLIFVIIAATIIGKYSGIFNILNWIITAIILSVFGTLGDLIESKFKRQANLKDSGTIMPGHGGILDRFDSLFFAAPFVYLYLHYLL